MPLYIFFQIQKYLSLNSGIVASEIKAEIN